MNIRTDFAQAQGAPAAAQVWRGIAECRLRFAMRRLRGEVLQAHVRLVDVNGPRGSGGGDQRCQILLTTKGLGTVVVHATRCHPLPPRAGARSGLQARRHGAGAPMAKAAPHRLPAGPLAGAAVVVLTHGRTRRSLNQPPPANRHPLTTFKSPP